jgi:ADP-heptose:LPS heptosyltransferase
MPSYLLIQTGHLRETVHGLLLAQSIKRQAPDSRIVWLGRHELLGLARISPSVDSAHGLAIGGGIFDFIRVLRAVRLDAAETAIDLQGLIRTGILLRLSGARERIGRRDDREGAGFLFYKRRPELPPAGARSHPGDITRYFLGSIGLKNEFHWPIAVGRPLEFNAAFEPLADIPRPIVIFPDARRKAHRWLGFCELTNFILLNAPNTHVVWCAAEAHEGRDSWKGGRFHNLTGKTTVDALPEILRRASIVISNDTGAAELASALGISTLTIYGSTDPTRSGPQSNQPGNHMHVRSPLAEIHRLPVRDVWESLQAHPDWSP